MWHLPTNIQLKIQGKTFATQLGSTGDWPPTLYKSRALLGHQSRPVLSVEPKNLVDLPWHVWVATISTNSWLQHLGAFDLYFHWKFLHFGFQPTESLAEDEQRCWPWFGSVGQAKATWNKSSSPGDCDGEMVMLWYWVVLCSTLKPMIHPTLQHRISYEYLFSWTTTKWKLKHTYRFIFRKQYIKLILTPNHT